MISDEYAAGFFDGEGTVGVYTSGARKTGYMSVRIIQKYPEVLKQFKGRYGGSLSQGSRGYWTWKLHGGLAVRFLMHIIPFLIEKKRQAELSVEYQVMMNELPHRTSRISAEDVAKRNTIADQLKKMKRSDAYA